MVTLGVPSDPFSPNKKAPNLGTFLSILLILVAGEGFEPPSIGLWAQSCHMRNTLFFMNIFKTLTTKWPHFITPDFHNVKKEVKCAKRDLKPQPLAPEAKDYA